MSGVCGCGVGGGGRLVAGERVRRLSWVEVNMNFI